mmetsp:Transcript_76930/g.222392  ORF Transcript_76930/g.222392 Transcript_76930/m.222392 type:complete len:279 (-) Transcript_76930:1195-2031(-)
MTTLPSPSNSHRRRRLLVQTLALAAPAAPASASCHALFRGIAKRHDGGRCRSHSFLWLPSPATTRNARNLRAARRKWERRPSRRPCRFVALVTSASATQPRCLAQCAAPACVGSRRPGRSPRRSLRRQEWSHARVRKREGKGSPHRCSRSATTRTSAESPAATLMGAAWESRHAPQRDEDRRPTRNRRARPSAHVMRPAATAPRFRPALARSANKLQWRRPPPLPSSWSAACPEAWWPTRSRPCRPSRRGCWKRCWCKSRASSSLAPQALESRGRCAS